LRIVVPVMGALVGAHRRGLVHCDLKPENLFLARRPFGVVPTVIDFGVAKVRDASDAHLRTATGVMVGTPSYMSPEQASGGGSVDAQSDGWAMGVVLYELLTGRLPYEASTPALVLAQVIYNVPTPIEQWGVPLARDLVAVVHRAMERDRSRRFATMQSFVEALLETDAWAGSDAPHPSYDTTEPDAPLEADVDPSLNAPARFATTVRDAPPRARGWVYLLVAVVVVAIATLVAVLLRA
jgi:serine/threonine-protein kinase